MRWKGTLTQRGPARLYLEVTLSGHRDSEGFLQSKDYNRSRRPRDGLLHSSLSRLLSQ